MQKQSVGVQFAAIDELQDEVEVELVLEGGDHVDNEGVVEHLDDVLLILRVLHLLLVQDLTTKQPKATQ